ncbi:MAG TPA: GNAT family N-acetyltransferase, partial [Burkholderiaceae bacterium]|nr:GNAT family N-acetyltransferase [Burkholderiaceae bacterium]
MTIIHRVAQPKDIERLSAMLDAEFIFGKGRKTSIAQRFPSTLSVANVGNIFLAEENANIVSAFLCKRFAWHQQSRIWQGAMVGSVYSAPKRRGEGIGSALMKWGMQALQDSGVEFGVLWTTQAKFYERLGWTVADTGVFGSSDSDAVAGDSLDSISVMPLPMSDERVI